MHISVTTYNAIYIMYNSPLYSAQLKINQSVRDCLPESLAMLIYCDKRTDRIMLEFKWISCYTFV